MLKKKLGLEGIETIYPSYYYLKVPSTLIIPEGCVDIGSRVFKGCRWLEKVVIPKSVKRIGNEAFCDCHRLKKVEIPEGVEEIWDGAFWGCEEATITLRKPKKDFAKIGVRAFYGVRKVKEEIIY